jgi:hypothetical protein
MRAGYDEDFYDAFMSTAHEWMNEAVQRLEDFSDLL